MTTDNVFKTLKDEMQLKGIEIPEIPKTYRDYMKFTCEEYNRRKGKLNETDGINCSKCLNRGNFEIFNEETGNISLRQCSCMQKRQDVETLLDSGLGELLKRSFDTYNAVEEWQIKAKEKAMKYADSKGTEWFFLGGQSGSGKTHLCTAICKEIINNGKSFKYLLWEEMLETFKNPKSEKYQELQTHLRNRDVIYIDDFLKPIAEKVIKNKKLSFDDEEELKEANAVINQRYFLGKKTIISSELYVQEIRELNEATAGRIKEKCGEHIAHIARDPKRNYRFKNVEML